MALENDIRQSRTDDHESWQEGQQDDKPAQQLEQSNA
jgi:hypothetical protein